MIAAAIQATREREPDLFTVVREREAVFIEKRCAVCAAAPRLAGTGGLCVGRDAIARTSDWSGGAR